MAGFIGDMNFLEGEVVEAGGDALGGAVGPMIVRGLGEARRGTAGSHRRRPENVTIEAGSASAAASNCVRARR